MPAGQTEYAFPYILPCWALAAAFTAQWRAQETSEDRPASMSSKAPLRTESGAVAAEPTVAAEPMSNPSTWDSQSSPSAVKNPPSPATHSCSRTCGWILKTISADLPPASRGAVSHTAPGWTLRRWLEPSNGCSLATDAIPNGPLNAVCPSHARSDTSRAHRPGQTVRRADARRGRDGPDITVPDVVAVTGRVLVTRWVDGTPLSRVIAAGTDDERHRAGLMLIRLFASAPVRAHLLHGDPPPGNFRLLPDGRLAVLDF